MHAAAHSLGSRKRSLFTIARPFMTSSTPCGRRQGNGTGNVGLEIGGTAAAAAGRGALGVRQSQWPHLQQRPQRHGAATGRALLAVGLCCVESGGGQAGGPQPCRKSDRAVGAPMIGCTRRQPRRRAPGDLVPGRPALMPPGRARLPPFIARAYCIRASHSAGAVAGGEPLKRALGRG